MLTLPLVRSRLSLFNTFICAFSTVISGYTHGEETPLASAERALNDGLPELTIAKLEGGKLSSKASITLIKAYLAADKASAANKALLANPEIPAEQQKEFKARILFLEERYEEALKIIDSAELTPLNELLRAQLLVKLNRQSQAIETLENLWQKKAQAVHPLCSLLLSELYLLDGRAVAAEKILEAELQLPKSLQAELLFLKAQIKLESGKPNEALSLLNNLLEEPHISATESTRANLLKVESFLASTQTNPDHATLASTTLFSLLTTLKEGPETHRALLLLQRISKLENQKQNILETLTDFSTKGENHSFTPYAKFHLAELLFESGGDENLKQAENTLTDFNFASPLLFTKSRLLLGNIYLKQEKPHIAAETFLSAEQTDTSKFQAAYASWLSGDWDRARALFKESSLSTDPKLAEASKANLATLIATDPTTKEAVEANDSVINDSLQIERAFAAVRKRDPKSEQLLQEFLKKSPTHPRAIEARIALAQVLLEQQPPKAVEAVKQLEKINTIPEADAKRVIFLHIKSFEYLSDWEKLITYTSGHIEKYPEAKYLPQIKLKLAEAHFENGDYNKAQIKFGEIAEQIPPENKGEEKEIALYYAGLSAARVATNQSKNAAITFFIKAIEQNGSLKKETLKNISILQLEKGQFEESQKAASRLRSISTEGSEDWFQSHVLLSNSTLALNTENSLSEAVDILSSALASENVQLIWKQRLLYLRGLAYEQNEKVSKALENYLLVIDQSPINNAATADWFWFEQAGFKAISLLEKQERWKAAIATAKRIASAQGPSTEKATNYAEKMSLKHMVWETPKSSETLPANE